MFGVSREVVERIRKDYPAGCRVQLVRMEDPYSKIEPGEKGTVRCVDDIGTIHVNWDCGSSLGVAYGEDYCRRIEEITVTCYGEKEVWTSREEAKKFYLLAMAGSEGSEHERYSNIYMQLCLGLTECSDEEE